ncbi:MAG TPA: tRNA pseudouridine(38-40) synthase TruA [Candidatus Cloacimonadota bacterium]|nr:tRNA pseudouridine(38-40) synthase TruA [Candidatus Cloacimonadota bacterium]
MNKRRIAIQIAYDGSVFYGWQKQYISPTVQELVEQGLSEIFKELTLVTGSGRTDSGVHATCQMAHFDFNLNMNMEQIRLAVKSKLPHSIQVIKAWEVCDEFHARYSAEKRSYTYLISKDSNPFVRQYQADLWKYKIRTEKIVETIPYFLGEHDFTSFCKPNPEVKNHVCNISHLSFEETDRHWVLKISANRFLHNMVRRIVGALVAISHKNHPSDIVCQWIEAKKHEQKNFFTAPAQGLYLCKVEYPEHLFPFQTIDVPII